MNAVEYAQLIKDSRDFLFDKIRAALPDECQMEKRIVSAGATTANEWAAALTDYVSGSVRILILTIADLGTADLAKTAGAKNFHSEVKIRFDLYHDYLQGTDADNSQAEFEADALALQFAIETNRFLEPKGKIEEYSMTLGVTPSAPSLHVAQGEIKIIFREIRY